MGHSKAVDKASAVDFISFVFHAQRDYAPSKPLFIDAQVPVRSLDVVQTRSLYLYAALLYGIISFGGVACGVNPVFKFEELDHLVRQSEAKVIVAIPDSLPTVLEVAGANEISTNRIFVLDDLDAPLDFIANDHHRINNPDKVSDGSSASQDDTKSFTDLLRHGESDCVTLESEQALRETPAIYYPTSGTSGLPKLVVLSHHNLIMQHHSLHQDVPYGVVRVLCLPCFYLFGAAWLFGSTLRYGEPAYIMPRFHLDDYLRHLARYGATEAYLTPPVRDPVPVWGMTEVGVACLFRYGDAGAYPGAVGRLLDGYDVKLVDPASGREVGAANYHRVPGELFVRSPNVMMGYKGITAPSQDEGRSEWFPTGDLVLIEDGKVYVVGRTKELIKTKGWQVAPAEIEALIQQHPGVRDCAVVGVRSDDGTTEVPRAYVVRKVEEVVPLLLPHSKKKKKPVSGDDIYGLVAGSLASYKRLEGGVVFVTTIPRTASGKTQRFKLVQTQGVVDVDDNDDTSSSKRMSVVRWAQDFYAMVRPRLTQAFD
ncbi:hypothetical protein PG994_009730 [Apiospora phragmitis]|uniref:Uncharacterized protein n=1 Tax=Apiospora phragmitis TaxID=2905665 RepID=A0ABR1U9N5_9PEZI